jgi:hypothetical protein
VAKCFSIAAFVFSRTDLLIRSPLRIARHSETLKTIRKMPAKTTTNALLKAFYPVGSVWPIIASSPAAGERDDRYDLRDDARPGRRPRPVPPWLRRSGGTSPMRSLMTGHVVIRAATAAGTLATNYDCPPSNCLKSLCSTTAASASFSNSQFRPRERSPV